MAVSNLITQGQSFQRPSVSAYFGKGKAPGNDNAVKTSSSMFDESFLTGVVQSLTGINGEIKRIQESAKKTVLGLNRVINSLKGLSKSIVQRFGALNNEISAGRVDMARNMIGAPPAPAIDDGMPIVVAKDDKPVEPPKADGGGSGLGMSDIVAGVLSALSMKGLTSSALGLLPKIAAFFGAGGIGAPLLLGTAGLVAFGTAILAAAGLGDLIEKWTGIKEKLAAMEKTPEYQEMRAAQGAAAQRAAGGEGGPAGRAARTDQRQAIITKFGLKMGDLSQDPSNPNIMIHKDGRKFDLTTGDVVSGTTAAPPAATPAPSTPAAPAAPAPSSSSSSGIAPDIAAKAANYKEMGRKGVPLPPEIAADPIHGRSALTSWKEGEAEAKSGLPVRSKYTRNKDEKGGRDLDQEGMQQDTAFSPGGQNILSFNPLTGAPLKDESTKQFRQRAMGQRMANASAEDKAGFERISIGTDGTDYSQYNQTQWVDKIVNGEKVQVPIYFNPITGKSYSPESAVKSAERNRPEMLRAGVERFERQQQVDAMNQAEQRRLQGSVRPLEPTVVNTSSMTNIGSTEGGEGNNVAGTNLPLSATNPHIQDFLAKQNLHYQ